MLLDCCVKFDGVACAAGHVPPILVHLRVSCRMIINADKCMLFEPNSSSSQKFLDLVLPRLAASDSERAARALRALGRFVRCEKNECHSQPHMSRDCCVGGAAAAAVVLRLSPSCKRSMSN